MNRTKYLEVYVCTHHNQRGAFSLSLMHRCHTTIVRPILLYGAGVVNKHMEIYLLEANGNGSMARCAVLNGSSKDHHNGGS